MNRRERDAEAARQSAEVDRDVRVAALVRTEWARERRDVQFKAAYSGTAGATLARLSVCDRTHDVLDPGLLLNDPDELVPVSAFQHELMTSPEAVPAGWAHVYEADGYLRADVVFDDTPVGMAAAERVARDKPDWSFGYRAVQTRPLTPAEVAEGATRGIAHFLIVEVSPVSRGASISSGTAHTCLGGPEACPLDGGKGACNCATCIREVCPRGLGIPPTAQRRLALDARAVVLDARQSRLDAKAEAEREDRVAAILAQQDAYEAAERQRVETEEAARAERIKAIYAAAGEPVPSGEPEVWSGTRAGFRP